MAKKRKDGKWKQQTSSRKETCQSSKCVDKNKMFSIKKHCKPQPLVQSSTTPQQKTKLFPTSEQTLKEKKEHINE